MGVKQVNIHSGKSHWGRWSSISMKIRKSLWVRLLTRMRVLCVIIMKIGSLLFLILSNLVLGIQRRSGPNVPNLGFMMGTAGVYARTNWEIICTSRLSGRRLFHSTPRNRARRDLPSVKVRFWTWRRTFVITALKTLPCPRITLKGRVVVRL